MLPPALKCELISQKGKVSLKSKWGKMNERRSGRVVWDGRDVSALKCFHCCNEQRPTDWMACALSAVVACVTNPLRTVLTLGAHTWRTHFARPNRTCHMPQLNDWRGSEGGGAIKFIIIFLLYKIVQCIFIIIINLFFVFFLFILNFLIKFYFYYYY